MQEFLNQTSDLAETAVNSALNAAYLATYFGLSYIVLAMAASILSRLVPSTAGSKRDSR